MIGDTDRRKQEKQWFPSEEDHVGSKSFVSDKWQGRKALWILGIDIAPIRNQHSGQMDWWRAVSRDERFRPVIPVPLRKP